MLGVEAESLTPDEVIRAILCAPVDLFWNGGIGTFVKAGTESNADVGDRTNDAIRVDAAELRCAVIARRRQPRAHPARARRVRPRGWPDQHRRDRQLGRCRLLRPRGEHQDPVAGRDLEWRARRGRSRALAARDDRRGRVARAGRQRGAGERAGDRLGRGVRVGRRACPPDRATGAGRLRAPRPCPRSAAHAEAACRSATRRARPHRARARGAAGVHEARTRARAGRVRRARRPVPAARARGLLPDGVAHAVRCGDRRPPAPP